MSVPDREIKIYQAISASLVQAIKGRIDAYDKLPPKNPDKSDGTICDARCHHVLFEDEDVRIINVVDRAGKRGYSHTHMRAAVLYVDMPAKAIYYDDDALDVHGVQMREEERCLYFPEEGHHSIENKDTKDFCAFRIEFKRDIASFEVLESVLIDCLSKYKGNLKSVRNQLLKKEHNEERKGSADVTEPGKAPELLLLKTAIEQAQAKSKSEEPKTVGVKQRVDIASFVEGSSAKAKA
jgi:hypothetical protein